MREYIAYCLLWLLFAGFAIVGGASVAGVIIGDTPGKRFAYLVTGGFYLMLFFGGIGRMLTVPMPPW